MRAGLAIAKKEFALSVGSFRTQLILLASYFFSAFFFFYLLSTYNSEILRLAASQQFLSQQLPALEDAVFAPYFHSASLLLLLALPFLMMDFFVRERQLGFFHFELMSGTSRSSRSLGRFAVVFALLLLLTLIVSFFPVVFVTAYGGSLMRVLVAALVMFVWLLALGALSFFVCSHFKTSAAAALVSLSSFLALYALNALDSYSSAFTREILSAISPVYAWRRAYDGLLVVSDLSLPLAIFLFFLFLTHSSLSDDSSREFS